LAADNERGKKKGAIPSIQRERETKKKRSKKPGRGIGAGPKLRNGLMNKSKTKKT